MKRTVIILALLVMSACTQSRSGLSAVKESLLQTVPCEAVSVTLCDRLSDAVFLNGSVLGELGKLDFSAVASGNAALSTVFLGKLVPILAIDAGKASSDTSDAVKQLLEQACARNIGHIVAHTGRGRTTLVLTPSASALSSVKRHIDSRKCILDVQLFHTALNETEGCGTVKLIRGSDIARFVPAKRLDVCADRRDINSFLQRLGRWNAFCISGLDGQGNCIVNVKPVGDPDCAWWSEVTARLSPSACELGHILPAGVQFALSLPLGAGWREVRESNLDARTLLERFKQQQKALKFQPEEWVARNGIKEMALVRFGNGKTVLLERTGGKDALTGPYGYQGFAAASFGKIFNIGDESSCAVRKGWTIIGSEENVNSFVAEIEKEGNIKPDFPEGLLKYALCTEDMNIYADKNCIRINVTNNKI